MDENRTIHLADIPIGGKPGAIWNRLHGEREDICEALVKEFQPASQGDDRRQLFQARLRKVDDALDRLMSGSYGMCSNCGRPKPLSIPKTLDVQHPVDLGGLADRKCETCHKGNEPFRHPINLGDISMFQCVECHPKQ